MDWTSFTEHVVVDQRGGFCERFLFTPDDPEAFKAVLEEAVRNLQR